MHALPNMVDMQRSENQEPMDAPTTPQYPYGLSLCFGQEEIDKLDLDDDVEVGDYLHIFAFARVTSVNKSEIDGKPNCRIEMTLTHIAAEDEDAENEEYEDRENTSGKMYGRK